MSKTCGPSKFSFSPSSYNFENNQNMGNSKTSELPTLFKDRGESTMSEVPNEKLAAFWAESSLDVKKQLLSKMQENSKVLSKGGMT